MAYDYARPINVIAPELVSALAMAQADLARPIVYFTSVAVSVTEGNSGTKTLAIEGRRSSLSGALNVVAVFAPGSSGTADFSGNAYPGNKTLAFVNGSDTASFSVVVSGDTDVESDDTFTFTLQAGSSYRLGTPSTVTGTILNDDTAGPTITPLPTNGLVAHWDPATLALADGAVVPEWTDKIGSTGTAYTGDSGAKHTYVANSGGLPAVRLSGQAVLAASDTNSPAYTAMTGSEQTLFVVVRNVLAPTDNPNLSAMVSCPGNSGRLILMANQNQTGRYEFMTDCADTGLRTIGYSKRGEIRMMSVKGSCIQMYSQGTGSHINIGGWENRSSQFCGRADVLAIFVYNRALTRAEHKQIEQRYRDLLGLARITRNVTALGDSITADDGDGVGIPTANGFRRSYIYQMALGLGLEWGSFDNLGYHGFDWNAITTDIVPELGNLTAAIGRRDIVTAFEFANMRGSGSGTAVAGAAQNTVNAVKAASPSAYVILGTSTDDGSGGSGGGVATRSTRRDYNAAVANVTGVSAVVNIHLDPNIGVEGAAPTNGVANTYYRADGLHLLAPGSMLLDNGPYGFRPAVVTAFSA